MDQGVRWAVAFAVAIFIVLLIVLARGEPFRGEPTPPPTAIVAAW